MKVFLWTIISIDCIIASIFIFIYATKFFRYLFNKIRRCIKINDDIKNCFFGFKFGQTVESFYDTFNNNYRIEKLDDILKGEGYKISTDTFDLIPFNGFLWNSITFYFYDNKFYSIEFDNYGMPRDPVVPFDKLYDVLAQKYKFF